MVERAKTKLSVPGIQDQIMRLVVKETRKYYVGFLSNK